MVIKNSPQIDMSVERGQKGTPDKLSEYGNFQYFVKSSRSTGNFPNSGKFPQIP
jgi:hypothetical protein